MDDKKFIATVRNQKCQISFTNEHELKSKVLVEMNLPFLTVSSSKEIPTFRQFLKMTCIFPSNNMTLEMTGNFEFLCKFEIPLDITTNDFKNTDFRKGEFKKYIDYVIDIMFDRLVDYSCLEASNSNVQRNVVIEVLKPLILEVKDSTTWGFREEDN